MILRLHFLCLGIILRLSVPKSAVFARADVKDPVPLPGTGPVQCNRCYHRYCFLSKQTLSSFSWPFVPFDFWSSAESTACIEFMLLIGGSVRSSPAWRLTAIRRPVRTLLRSSQYVPISLSTLRWSSRCLITSTSATGCVAFETWLPLENSPFKTSYLNPGPRTEWDTEDWFPGMQTPPCAISSIAVFAGEYKIHSTEGVNDSKS